jgi:GlcNAc-P-P-Und epimerase
MAVPVTGVIGGSGFIGSALVRALRRAGHEVRIIDRAPSRAYPDAWIEADVRDGEALLQACRGCDVLYNLAAEHRDDVRPLELYHQVNVMGAQHTCEVAEQLSIERLIFTSTVAVYGMQEGEADETAATRPFNEYGRTKLEAEREFRARAERGAGRSLTIVRPTVVFESSAGTVSPAPAASTTGLAAASTMPARRDPAGSDRKGHRAAAQHACERLGTRQLASSG